MRKTQVALAALALMASTAALANGVSIYGTADASLYNAGGTTGLAGSGNWGTTALGFKGTEDLGGGMKASFNLEQGMNLNNGGSANPGVTGSTFNRLANVGLSGDFGAVSLGLQLSPFIASSLGGYANGNASFYVASLALTSTAVASYGSAATATAGFFIPNAISYSLPSIGGVNATVLTALDGGVTANQYTAVSVGTAVGAIGLNGAYQQRGGAAGTGYKSYNINASTNVGEVRVAGGYTSHDVEGTGAGQAVVNGYNIGASYALNSATAVSLNYASATGSKTITNAGVTYNLSKSTFLYGTLSYGKNGAMVVYEGSPTYTTGNKTGYAVGVAHSF